VILAAFLLYLGFLEEILTTLFLVVIVVPRYLRWRRTEYVLTRDTLFYQQGGVAGIQKYEVPISTLRDVRSRFGIFGKSLGYEGVDVMLDNGAVASLQYVPVLYGLGPLIQRLIDTNPPTDEPKEPAEDDPASLEDRS
jgi:membrane protein YdbS with pleckstrin-like domain